VCLSFQQRKEAESQSQGPRHRVVYPNAAGRLTVIEDHFASLKLKKGCRAWAKLSAYVEQRTAWRRRRRTHLPVVSNLGNFDNTSRTNNCEMMTDGNERGQ
jgi:hypothetical protein